MLTCSDNNAFAGIGYCDWKNAVCRIERHENSQSHRVASLAMFNRSDAKNRVDNKLLEQQKAEVAYSSAVLERVVAVIKHLAERGLSFRGHDELLGSVHNGNYLGTLEFLAQFDPFIAAHIEKYGGKGKGSVSFISSTICNELIDIMGGKVRKFIIDQVKETKYFSLTVDSTPDISHIDRLACVLRYVLEDGPVERFIQFLDMKGHTAEEMLKRVLGFFEKEGINIENCRGQSYDNASNMSGKYGGLQALIREKNELADWVPCFAHSLNLVGHCAVDCVPGATSFFSFVQKLYTFFSASPHRWDILLNELREKRLPVVKRLCDTRWSAHSAATSALKKSYENIRAALVSISNDANEEPAAKQEANGLQKKMDQLENCILLELWETVLERFHKTSMKLQSADLDLNEAVALLESLMNYTTTLRDSFDDFEEKGRLRSRSKSYKTEVGRKCTRSVRLTLNDGAAEEAEFTPSVRFRVEVYLPILDKLHAELNKRLQAYAKLSHKFGFLHNVLHLDAKQLKDGADNLVQQYPNDLEPSLAEELVHFREYFKGKNVHRKEDALDDSDEGVSVELQMYRILAKREIHEVFPNVEIALRIYLTLMVSNCSGERSFSALKRIKNVLRSTMTDQKLNNLSIMSIEAEVLRKIDFHDIIKEFASRKCRKSIL